MRLEDIPIRVLAKAVFDIMAYEDAVVKPIHTDMRKPMKNRQALANHRKKPLVFKGASKKTKMQVFFPTGDGTVFHFTRV